MIKFFLLSLFLFIQFSVTGQNENFREIFGKKYQEAENFISQNRNHFGKYFPDSSDFLLAASIVFPEIIRFNVLNDKLEVGALKTLYVQYGEKYANFSIGPFQMKPTFAEQLEKKYYNLNTKSELNPKILFDTASTNDARLKRVERLSNMDGQLMYLSLFYVFSKEQFHELAFESITDLVRFIATAYNSGFQNPNDYLLKKEKEKHFHTEVLTRFETPKYCYADISAFYFEQHFTKKNNGND